MSTEARELAQRFGVRMCDENGMTHGEELYCFGLDDIIAMKEALAKQEQGEPVAIAWAAFTEACQRVSSPEQSDDLRDAIDRMTDAIMERDERAVTPDYVQGHKDGCEWSARLAEASDPRTSDWLYDDPHELAKALRKGPDFGDLYTTPQQRKPLTDEQADSIINGLRTCLHRDSMRQFLKVWLRDWAAHGAKDEA